MVSTSGFTALMPDLHAPSAKARVKVSWLWTVEGSWVRHVIHLRCLTRFLCSSSECSICEPHRPVPGLSHAPSSPAAQARGSRRAPSCCSTISSSHLWFHPVPLCRTACTPESWAWKSCSVQTLVKSTLSPHDPCPCSTNIWRTAHSPEFMGISTLIVFVLILSKIKFLEVRVGSAIFRERCKSCSHVFVIPDINSYDAAVNTDTPWQGWLM